jgi:hypothetical protein
VAKHDSDTTAERPERPVAESAPEPGGTETTAHRVGPALRHGAATGWRGFGVVRKYVAKGVVWAALAVALLLGIGALLVGFGANPHNVLVNWVVSAANRIDGPFGDLFTFRDHVKQTLVNWVIAAVAYLAAGGILARLIRP